MLESICNLGVRPTKKLGASYVVFRIANGNWAEAQYQIGARFERTSFTDSDRGMVLTDHDGDKIYVPAGEYQCFREVELRAYQSRKSKSLGANQVEFNPNDF